MVNPNFDWGQFERRLPDQRAVASHRESVRTHDGKRRPNSWRVVGPLIMAKLREAKHCSVEELMVASGARPQYICIFLHALEVSGLVRRRRKPGKRIGRPAYDYELVTHGGSGV